ncbi:GntR family transcriptional regulator [Chelativorans sp. AA-79]|uniref:GntR family transcriptional regulator n=1 Tax=Chelativorans sp. AA-79 TaxID=3028735 RepID=UPI0023F79AE9|nr:GntR family transcriptional regulator [Chelativorans sp. AA-79]WEX10458.1 GntR family transcriptional regulator [Chelativorans sp. AA-79]
MQKDSFEAAMELVIEDGPGPAYRRLAEALARRVSEGVIAVGSALPTERSLAEKLGVARVTVRAAYRSLCETGILETRQGSGTFVRAMPTRIEQPLWQLSSFSEEMMKRGYRPTTRVLHMMVVEAATGERAALALADKEEVVRLKRLRLADGMPLAIETAAVPAYILADAKPGSGSLYRLLAERGHRPVRATQRLSAISLDAASAKLLETARGAAALLMERTSYGRSGRAVEYTHSIYRGDAYNFVAELKDGSLDS